MTEGLRLAEVADRLAPAGRRDPLWVTIGTLLDGTSTTPLADAHLVYDADAILHVGDRDHPPPPECLPPGRSEPDVRLPGCTVLPGLLEAHAHLVLDGAERDRERRSRHLRRPASELLADARERARGLPSLGVMAVRDAGDAHGVGLALSRSSGEPSPDAPLPWVDSPGPVLHHRGAYGGFIGGAMEDHDSPESCVESRVQTGARRVKLMVSGVIDFEAGRVTTPPQMSGAEVRALTRAALDRDLPAFAHASGVEGIENALAGHIESIEHGYFVTKEQLARMRDRQIAWVPTLCPVRAQLDHADRLGWSPSAVGHLQRILDGHGESLRHAAETGVTLMAGSDAGSYGVPHGRGLLRELELLEQAGVRSLDVLNAATGVSATHLGLGDRLGCLRAGRRSRMIFVERNPLETVSHLGREAVRLFDGKVLRSGEDSRPKTGQGESQDERCR